MGRRVAASCPSHSAYVLHCALQGPSPSASALALELTNIIDRHRFALTIETDSPENGRSIRGEDTFGLDGEGHGVLAERFERGDHIQA